MSYVEGTDMSMEELHTYLTRDPALDIYYRYEYGVTKGWYVGHLWEVAKEGLLLELTNAMHTHWLKRYDHILAEYDEADARRMEVADTSYPLICYKDPRDQRLEIADGFHRLFATGLSQQYGLDYVVIELPPPDLVNNNHTESGKHFIFNRQEN